jgi:hypothetical protein
MNPLRLGARCTIRQTTTKRLSVPRTRRRDYRYVVSFAVELDGRARWTGGVEPTDLTLVNVQRMIDRRFCSERHAGALR